PPTSDDVDANTAVAAEKGRDEVAFSQDTPASAVEAASPASDDRLPGSAAVQANNSLLLPSQNVEVEATAASAARAAAAAAGGNTDAAGDSRLPAFLRDLCASPDPRADVLARWQLLERDEAARVGMAYRARGPADPFSASVGITAGTRNRYPNIWPFNDNRVQLAAADVTAAATSDPNDHDPASDYINASFPLSQPPRSPAVSPPSVALMAPPSHYIATQAPLQATFEAFWQMAWDHDVRVILMLCELSGRTAAYWPSAAPPPPALDADAVSFICGPGITTARNTHRRRYRYTTATTTAGPAATAVSSRVVAHIHYTAWPDTTVPAHLDELLALRFLVAQVRAAVEPPLQQPERPILVHCSAGCGRTGAYI
ncbi:hypothetical protein HK405_016014, partial [Cladochytrium tenue]